MNLERKFAVESEKRYLLKNPTLAIELALNYKEDFLSLAEEFRALEKRNQTLEQKYKSVMADNQLLTSQLIDASKREIVRIPSFLSCQKH